MLIVNRIDLTKYNYVKSAINVLIDGSRTNSRLFINIKNNRGSNCEPRRIPDKTGKWVRRRKYILIA